MNVSGSAAYGNVALVPLRGGSGGGGAAGLLGGGGGGGGGAIRIASSVSISIAGSVVANGGGASGTGGSSYAGGGGSGGAIHLIAPIISGAGAIQALGGVSTSSGSVGRIRFDAYQTLFTGTSTPARVPGTPYPVPLPANVPSVRVLSVAGIAINSNPSGTFTTPDAVFTQPGPVTVAIEAVNVPLGTIVKLYLLSEGGPDQIINSTALAGTLQLSTATASATFPPGYSRGYVKAAW